jgi:hypothetical protein
MDTITPTCFPIMLQGRGYGKLKNCKLAKKQKGMSKKTVGVDASGRAGDSLFLLRNGFPPLRSFFRCR